MDVDAPVGTPAGPDVEEGTSATFLGTFGDTALVPAWVAEGDDACAAGLETGAVVVFDCDGDAAGTDVVLVSSPPSTASEFCG